MFCDFTIGPLVTLGASKYNMKKLFVVSCQAHLPEDHLGPMVL